MISVWGARHFLQYPYVHKMMYLWLGSQASNNTFSS